MLTSIVSFRALRQAQGRLREESFLDPSHTFGRTKQVRRPRTESYLGNVEQNDSRKIYPAKAPRRKVKKILRILRTFAPLRETWFFRSSLRFRISNTFG